VIRLDESRPHCGDLEMLGKEMLGKEMLGKEMLGKEMLGKEMPVL